MGGPVLRDAVLMAVPALLLLTCLLGYRLEERRWEWAAFAERRRLGPLSARQWALAPAVAVAMVSSYVLVRQLSTGWQSLILNRVQSEPKAMLEAPGDDKHCVGFALQGAWWLPGIWFVGYFFNVVAEELWWRGVILRRQEPAQRRWAWVLNGLQWPLFHPFKLASLWKVLPEALLLVWSCQCCRSLWLGLVAHGLLNAMVALRLRSDKEKAPPVARRGQVAFQGKRGDVGGTETVLRTVSASQRGGASGPAGAIS